MEEKIKVMFDELVNKFGYKIQSEVRSEIDNYIIWVDNGEDCGEFLVTIKNHELFLISIRDKGFEDWEEINQPLEKIVKEIYDRQ